MHRHIKKKKRRHLEMQKAFVRACSLGLFSAVKELVQRGVDVRCFASPPGSWEKVSGLYAAVTRCPADDSEHSSDEYVEVVKFLPTWQRNVKPKVLKSEMSFL